MISIQDRINVLYEYLTPSHPIQSPEHLWGRTEDLKQAIEALGTPGRNLFVFGDRGVGKTSLAQTAAFQFQSADQEPVLLACDPGITAWLIVRDAVRKLIKANPLEKDKELQKAAETKIGFFGASIQTKIRLGEVPVPSSLNEAIALLDYGAALHSREPVVLLDEFDRLTQDSDRVLFGDLIKQLGDQRVPVKFVLAGVGKSLDDLLASHQSSYRYLSSIRLERLKMQALIDLIQQTAKALEIEIPMGYLYRISMISDGFPHYAHLIGQKIFLPLIQQQRSLVTPADFALSLQNAARDVEPRLLSQYRQATEKYLTDYQEVLWAAAAHPSLRRPAAEIFESYKSVMNFRQDRESITRSKFFARLNKLKTEAHGSILLGSRQGWYEFREPMMRGYCRLRAVEHDVIVGDEYYV